MTSSIQIARAVGGFMAEDGSEIHLTFEDNERREHVLAFEPDTLETVAMEIAALIVRARTLRDRAAGHQIVHAIEPTGFSIAPIPFEDKLVVTFVGDGGIEHSFAMPASEGHQFRQDMFAAEKKCKRSGPPTQH